MGQKLYFNKHIYRRCFLAQKERNKAQTTMNPNVSLNGKIFIHTRTLPLQRKHSKGAYICVKSKTRPLVRIVLLSSLGTHGAVCTQVTLELFDCFHSDSFMWVCLSIPSPHDRNHSGLHSPSSVPEHSLFQIDSGHTKSQAN